MRVLVLAIAVALTAVPAMAGGFSVNLPHLVWPQGDQTSTSTKGCEDAPGTVSAPCK
ncbi:hypothetical protein [Pseudotabrizicola algicola]|uniref:Uncharacterized protein n=1 Tax=Pseudotabrizicola algicola TaxID=2709381 RepID=A0A6B3RSV3_9RHOB|nr:hypothetical protein [Pseudotabrizicola algicola]NEX46122.1 hypothetical protein [Pseudotabrizicola algicola]